jgi:hypothetical protein
VGYWLAGTLLLALASLAAARYITSPRWVDALFATGAFLGLAAGLALGMALRRALGRRDWKPPAALILGIAAAAVRSGLLLEAAGSPAPAGIQFGRISMACGTVVWGLLALLWGTQGVADAGEGGRTRWGMLLTSAGGVILALFSLAPLWSLLGLRINHWTLLGLFGLACLAYSAGWTYRRIMGRAGREASTRASGKKR